MYLPYQNIKRRKSKSIKVGNVKMKMKSMKDHAHYDVDRVILQLSTKYKNLKDSQVKNFLITIVKILL